MFRLPALVIVTPLLLLLIVPAWTAAERDPPGLDVRIVSPAPEEVVEGTVSIQVEVIPQPGVEILKVDFYVDGKRIGWRDEPPYTLEWDAGRSLRKREIRVVAYGNDGITYPASIRTTGIRVDYRAEVSVVNVFATVRDFGGTYAGNLKADSFLLFEDGVQQSITHFVFENLPLSIAFVLDASLTMQGERIDTARVAAERFARSLDFSRDRALVVTFAGKPQLAMPLVDDQSAILTAIQGAVPQPGGTALYDAVTMAVEVLRPIEGRKAVILLTDGRDESGDGFHPGSIHTFEEALQAAHHASVILYTIGLGKGIREQMDFYGVRSVGTILTRFAEETGGRVFFANRPRQLRRGYETVATALRHQYNLGYSSTNNRHDGTWRQIQVRSTLEGYQVNARNGYYAPED